MNIINDIEWKEEMLQFLHVARMHSNTTSPVLTHDPPLLFTLHHKMKKNAELKKKA